MSSLKRKKCEESCSENDARDALQQSAASATVCSIGIDFGTARTGSAFAFKHNQADITCKEPGGQDAVKTNTALLLDSTGRFLAFGSKAIQQYYEDEGDNLLFERFKMELHTQGGGDARAVALNGQKLSLIDVITKTLQFIKTNALMEINKSQLADLKLDQIQWVLTVPAIWSDIAKAAMRRAAFQAGLVKEECSDLLELALEPEAACIACEEESANLKQGDTFMVLDCGGGTVDITMHRVAEKLPHLQLVEICPPSGGPWGSTFVDEEFERFLEKLVGAEAFKKFKPSSQWVDLMRTWEALKLSYDPSEDTGDVSKKPINVNTVLEVVEKVDLKTLVDAYNRSHGTALGVRGKSILLLPTGLIQSFFKPVISKIVRHVSELLEANDVKYIFLVGGFAESKMLYHRVKNEFDKSGRRVVVPRRPGLAVVKGAVMVGLGASKRFASRVARHTYGVRINKWFDPSNPDHEGRRKFTEMQEGRLVTNVGDVFFPIVRQGTSIAQREVHKGGSIYCKGDHQTSVTIPLYTTTNPDEKWTTDAGMKFVATISVPCKVGDELSVDLCFGKSEIQAVVNNKTSKSATRWAIEYDFSKL